MAASTPSKPLGLLFPGEFFMNPLDAGGFGVGNRIASFSGAMSSAPSRRRLRQCRVRADRGHRHDRQRDQCADAIRSFQHLSFGWWFSASAAERRDLPGRPGELRRQWHERFSTDSQRRHRRGHIRRCLSSADRHDGLVFVVRRQSIRPHSVT